MKIIFFICIGLFICSCAGAQTGIRISQVDFDSIEKGIANRAQIVKRFGRPQVISTLPDGKIQIIYSYARSEINPATCIPIVGLFAGGQKGESVTVTFLFDEKTNKLIEKSLRSSNYDTNIKR